jgi:hypothetical protein
MLKTDLQKNVRVLMESAREGEKWLSENEKELGNVDAVRKRLRRSARKLETYCKASDNKMGIAVFGPSQAGKSTFIGSLTKGNQKNLMVEFSAPGGKTTVLDFIWQVNPPGGGEATGLVTRFSLEAPPKSPNPDLPVCVKLFSEMDIVKILANTFFEEGRTAFNLEADGEEDLRNSISKTLLDLDSHKSDKNRAPTLDDMEDLAEYVENISKKYVYGNILVNSYWPGAIPLASKLNLPDRAELFSVIWGKATEFTKVYLKLCQALESLNFPEMAFTELKALYEGDSEEINAEGDGDTDNRANSILYVGMLDGLLADSTDVVEVMNPMGAQAAISRPVICALVAELHVKLTESPGAFMNNADILDFPGYRARVEYKNFLSDIQNPEILKNCFLRGKVDYLFQRFAAQKEVTTMLLCVRDSNFECPGLPEVIKNWVEETHGKTPADRTGKPVCLFFVLTFFNRQLEKQLGAPTTGTVWSKRFLASLTEPFGKDLWPNSWSLDSSNRAKPFRNCFWHLDPYYTNEFLTIEILDEKTKRYVSRGVREDKREWLTELETAYLNNDSVNTFIQNPAEAWKGALESQDGGVGYIISKLTPIVSRDIKTRQLADLALAEGESVRDTLNQYYHSDDNKAEKDKKNEIFIKLSDALFCLGNRDNVPYDFPNELFEKMVFNRFGSLLRDMVFTDDECYEFFSLPARTIEEELAALRAPRPDLLSKAAVAASPGPKPPADISGRFGNDNEGGKGVQGGSEPQNKPASRQDDQAQTSRKILEKRWLERLEALANSEVKMRYYGIPQADFRSLIKELQQGARRLNVMGSVEDAMRKELSYANVIPEKRLWKFSRLASAYISEYISFLGFSPRRLSSEMRMVYIEFIKKRILLFEPGKESEDFPQLPAEAKSYENSYNHDWQLALAKLMADNVDFSETNYDKGQNAKLGSIIEKLDADAEELRVGAV